MQKEKSIYLKIMIKVHTIDLNFLGLKRAIAAFLVETNEGPVLIESGPHSTFHNLSDEIRAYGYNVSDIKHVF